MADPAAFYPKNTVDFVPLLQALGDPATETNALVDAIVAILEQWAKS